MLSLRAWLVLFLIDLGVLSFGGLTAWAVWHAWGTW